MTNYVTCHNQSEFTKFVFTNQKQQRKPFSRAWSGCMFSRTGHRLHAPVRILIGSLHDLCGYDWPNMISRLWTFVLRTPRFCFQSWLKLWMNTVTTKEREVNECLKIAVRDS